MRDDKPQTVPELEKRIKVLSSLIGDKESEIEDLQSDIRDLEDEQYELRKLLATAPDDEALKAEMERKEQELAELEHQRDLLRKRYGTPYAKSIRDYWHREVRRD